MRFFALLLAILLVSTADRGSARDLADLVPDLLATPLDVNLIPQVTLIQGSGVPLVLTPSGGTWEGTFSGTEALDNISSQVQSQINRVPLGSSVAAFTFNFDTATNTFVRTTEGLGPLLAERAQTTGKQKLNVAYSYSFASFKVFEGQDLSHLPVSYAGTPALQPEALSATVDYIGADGTLSVQTSGTPPVFGGNNTIEFTTSDGVIGGQPFFTGTVTGDLVGLQGFLTIPDPTTRLDLDLTVQSFALFGTYGVTDTIDVGVVIPLLNVDEEAGVDITDGFVTGTGEPAASISAHDHDSNFGIGDVIFRGKWQFLTAEQAFVDQAVRADVIVPTGDEDNFCGTGHVALGVIYVASKDFGIWSPHLNAGFYVPVGLSHEATFHWDVGVDTWVLPRLTLVVDFLGAQKLDPDGNGDLILSMAGGIKWNVWRRLVVGAGVLGRLNDQGLRAHVIPSGTIEYTFF